MEADLTLKGELAMGINRKAQATKRVRRIELVNMLNHIALAVRRELDLQDILDKILGIVVESLEMESGVISLKDSSTGEIRIAVFRGITEEEVREIEKRRKSGQWEDISKQVLESRKVHFVKAMSTDSRFKGQWNNLEKRSFVDIPLIASDDVKGAMGLITRAGEQLTEAEANVLGAVGHQIGLIIENSNLLAESHRCEQDAIDLSELGKRISTSLEMDQVLDAVAKSVCKLLDAENGLVALLDEDEEAMVIRTVAGPLTSEIQGKKLSVLVEESIGGTDLWASNKSPVDILDSAVAVDISWIESLGVKYFLATPLIRGDRTLGIIGVLGRNSHLFTQRDMRLLDQLAQNVVVAIENAQLYCQVRSKTALEERSWLAREVHDSLAQGLGMINIQATVIEDLLSSGEIDHAKSSLAKMKEIANRSYTDVREAIFNLRTTVSPGSGFLPALQEYLDDYKHHYAIDTHLVLEDESAVNFSGEVSIQVARIIKEAIANARKHGGAKRVMICIEKEGNCSKITIADDGLGFDTSGISEANEQQHGLQIMSERARSVQGQLHVTSFPGSGTEVVIQVPLAT